MGQVRRAGLLALAVALGLASVGAASEKDGSVAVEPISYAKLGKLVRGLKGKVVLINFWAHY